jgi:putative transposase
MANQQLLEEIKAVHKQSRGRYGSPRVYEALRQLEIRCGRKRVARLMRQHGIRGKQRRRYKRITNSDHAQLIVPNLLQQDFTAPATNQKWCADITYVATREGWLYLAIIIDLCSRMIVGWAMGNDLSRHRACKAHLVLGALRMATRLYRPGPGLIHHSDRGSQYASEDYQRRLAAWKMLPTMSGVRNCYDNAPADRAAFRALPMLPALSCPNAATILRSPRGQSSPGRRRRRGRGPASMLSASPCPGVPLAATHQT